MRVCRRKWGGVSYETWSETCDTLHAHTQFLGKLAVALAPPEPQLQHAALRLTARRMGDSSRCRRRTAPGPSVVALDLRNHEMAIETSAKGSRRIALDS